MEIFLDCLPCTLRQALEASRMATEKPELQEKIIKESMKILYDYKKYKTSPQMCRAIHRIVMKETGNKDLYESVKQRDISEAKKVYPLLEEFLKKKQNSLYWALKIAATGNIIDSAINNNVDIQRIVEKELCKEFAFCDLKLFEEKLKTAKTLLIIGDNAGETVFDRILVKRLSSLDIIYAVRSEPIINDTTEKEAYESGLGDYAKIISTGCSAPGAVCEECSKEFLDIFKKSDIVISKGQGNFEALSDSSQAVFFLLKAKCHMIAEKLNVGLNDYVFKYNGENR